MFQVNCGEVKGKIMSKLRRSAPVSLLARGHDKNGNSKERYLQRSGQRSRPSEALTNIVEEDQGPENRDFDMDDAYLSECLQVLEKDSKSEVDVPDFGDVEEYDFDDFLSIASTTSFTNLVFETNDEITPEALQAPIARVPVKDASPVRSRLPRDRSAIEPQIVTTETPITTREVSRSVQEEVKSYSSSIEFTGPNPGSQTIKSQGEVTSERELNSVQSSQRNVPKVDSPDLEELTVTEESDDMAGRLTQTSALRAAENGDFITLQRLIDKYPDQSNDILLARDQTGNTPLHRAALCGQLECLKWLVSHVPEGSLSVRNRDDLTPAAGAAKYGHLECLQWLIEQTSASIELENNNVSLSLLHHAAVSGQEECLRFLLNFMEGKDLPTDIVDHTGITPTQLAAREGQMFCIQTLVEFNADVTVKDRGGRTAADYAYFAGHSSCARYLIAVESCWLLSSRVARLHQELRDTKEENQELKKKIEILEARASLPDRPDALGAHCQGDGSSSVDSLEGERENEHFFGKISKTSRCINNVPDGECFNDSSQQMSSNHRVVSTDAGIPNTGYGNIMKEKAPERFHSNTDSPTNCGILAPGENDGSEMQKVITKQMVAVTHRLMMNRHAQNAEERGSLGPGSTSRSSSSSSHNISFRHSDSPVFQERHSPSQGISTNCNSRDVNTNQAQFRGAHVPLRERKNNIPQQYRWTYAGETTPSARLSHERIEARGQAIQQTRKSSQIYDSTQKSIHKVIHNKKAHSKSSSSDSSVVSHQGDEVNSREKTNRSSTLMKCSSSECSCDEDSFRLKYDLTPTHSQSSISSECSSDQPNNNIFASKQIVPQQMAILLNEDIEKNRKGTRPPVARKPVLVNVINSLTKQRNITNNQPVIKKTFSTINNQNQVQNLKKNFENVSVARQQPVCNDAEPRPTSTSKQSVRVTFRDCGSLDDINESRDRDSGFDKNMLKGTSDKVHGFQEQLNGVHHDIDMRVRTLGMDQRGPGRNASSSVQYIVPLKGNDEKHSGSRTNNEIYRDFHQQITDPVSRYSNERLTPPLEASKNTNKANIVRLKAHEHGYLNGTTNRTSHQHYGKSSTGGDGILQENGDIYGAGDFISQPELSLGLRQSTLAKLESDNLPPPHFDEGYEPSKAWYED